MKRDRSALRPLSKEILAFAKTWATDDPLGAPFRTHLDAWVARARALEHAESDLRKVLAALMRERDAMEKELRALRPTL